MSSCKMAPLCFSACIQFLSGIFIFIQVSLGFSRDGVDAQNGKKRETACHYEQCEVYFSSCLYF